jgi:2',3'-cyclic-nucleotide 2'-phosphodiesterase (5'-nucleotidase family)
MRGRLVLLVLCVALVTVGCASVAPSQDAGLVHLTFIQVSDVYTLEPVDRGRRGGMARLATLVRRIRAENPNTLFVLGGDTLSPSPLSTVLQGRQMIAAFNAIGLDLATFGNHEFDFGPAVLAERMRESKFVWLSANVREGRSGAPLGGAERARLVTLEGIAIGLFGLTMTDTAHTSSPGPGVLFDEPLAAGRAAHDELRRRGARLVVALTHQPLADDRALAAAVDVDLVLGGHEHEPLVAEERRALVTKPGSDARYLVRIDLWLTREGQLVERTWSFQEVSARIPPDASVAALVEGYAAQTRQVLGTVVGHTTVPLEARSSRLRTSETNLGNFITDVMRERMGADVALTNGGGIRSEQVLPAGPVTRGNLLGFLPFTNVAVKLEMRGADLRLALEQGLADLEREGGGFLQVSGLSLTYDPTRPPGHRVLSVQVGGAALDDARTYLVAANDYIVRGGDGFTAFARGRIVVGPESGPDLSAIVLEAVSRRGTIMPRVEGRIRATTTR